MILSCLDSYEDCPLNEFSSSSLTVKDLFKWEVVLLVGSFLYADYHHISCLHKCIVLFMHWLDLRLPPRIFTSTCYQNIDLPMLLTMGG